MLHTRRGFRVSPMASLLPTTPWRLAASKSFKARNKGESFAYSPLISLIQALVTMIPPWPFVNRTKAIAMMCKCFQANDDLILRQGVPAASQFFGAGKTYVGENCQEKVKSMTPMQCGMSADLHKAFCDALYVQMDIRRA